MRVRDAFRLAGRTGGVKDDQRVLGGGLFGSLVVLRIAVVLNINSELVEFISFY